MGDKKLLPLAVFPLECSPGAIESSKMIGTQVILVKLSGAQNKFKKNEFGTDTCQD